MTHEEVRFFSHGAALAGTLMLPPNATGPVPVVTQGPGWLGLRTAKLYRRYHDALLDAGIAVFVFDYRGFGESEGDGTYLDPMAQVEDWRSAVTYLETRSEVDPDRIGAFGSGGTGGGNAVAVAGLDERIRATVSQVPIADGRDWLHRMRREHEWLEFLARVEADARQQVATGLSESVAPRDGIMVPTPERRATTIKSDVDARVPPLVQLASARAIMDFRPIDLVERIAPRALMIICVERDATTPEDHAVALYRRARAPKRLVVQRHTTHYGAYEHYGPIVAPMIVDWFRTYLEAGALTVEEHAAEDSVLHLSGALNSTTSP